MLSSVLLCWVFCWSLCGFWAEFLLLLRWDLVIHRLLFCGIVLTFTQLQIDVVHLLYSCISLCYCLVLLPCVDVVLRFLLLLLTTEKIVPQKYLTTRTIQKNSIKSQLEEEETFVASWSDSWCLFYIWTLLAAHWAGSTSMQCGTNPMKTCTFKDR